MHANKPFLKCKPGIKIVFDEGKGKSETSRALNMKDNTIKSIQLACASVPWLGEGRINSNVVVLTSKGPKAIVGTSINQQILQQFLKTLIKILGSEEEFTIHLDIVIFHHANPEN
ncbi:hypothetical protein RF11_08156 [Thelohanellus kitauei]|uniref:Uncharacterized protein n=1 Tax=Thelohanellus kitauei TaxID=669202 RepID=A0A0C2J8X4_THEKT|nr:hypothetical protein RF11_08156 [Thelohanellus kitauei]